MDELKAILANNLEVLMRESADLHTQSALAKRAHVAQTTIGNYLSQDYRGAPQLDKVAKLAQAFHLQVWQLLHPTIADVAIAKTELDLYRRLRAEIAKTSPQ